MWRGKKWDQVCREESYDEEEKSFVSSPCMVVEGRLR
jgi:hypothetical protein